MDLESSYQDGLEFNNFLSVEFFNDLANYLTDNIIILWIPAFILVFKIFSIICDALTDKDPFINKLCSLIFAYIYIEKNILQKESYNFVIITILTSTIYACTTSYSGKLSHSRLFNYFIMFCPIFVNEYYIFIENRSSHLQLRGVLMILVMKLGSIIIYNSKKKNKISVPKKNEQKSESCLSKLFHLSIDNLNYTTHPATIMLGPWHPKKPASSSGHCKSRYGLKNILLNYARLQLESILCVVFSDFILGLLLEKLDTTDLEEESPNLTFAIKVYLKTLQFRFSHYYICILSSSLHSLFNDTGQDWPVVNIINIEIPRSLTTVASNWNIPVHKWLRDIVFKYLKASTKLPLALLGTYVASCLLHGFKTQIWTVIISFLIFSSVEYTLRKRISINLSACVMAKECRRKDDSIYTACHHKRTKKNSYLVFLINTVFMIATKLQLIYLSYIFTGMSDFETRDTILTKWSSLYFYGHVICLSQLLLLFIFSDKTKTH